MTIPGKLEVTIKINQLPTEVTTDKNGWKSFVLDCGGRPVSVNIRPRMWSKLEEAAKSYPQWVAAIAGQIGQDYGKGGFVLREPNVQVFERKVKDEKPAEEGVAAPERSGG